MLSRCCRLEALWTSSASEGVFGYTTHATIRGCGFAFSTDAGLAGPVYCARRLLQPGDRRRGVPHMLNPGPDTAESNNKLLNLGRLRRMKAQRLATDTTSLILARHAEYAPAAAQLQWEDSTPSAVAADAAAHVAFTVYGERESTHRCPMRALYVQHLLKARFHIVPGVRQDKRGAPELRAERMPPVRLPPVGQAAGLAAAGWPGGAGPGAKLDDGDSGGGAPGGGRPGGGSPEASSADGAGAGAASVCGRSPGDAIPLAEASSGASAVGGGAKTGSSSSASPGGAISGGASPGGGIPARTGAEVTPPHGADSGASDAGGTPGVRSSDGCSSAASSSCIRWNVKNALQVAGCRKADWRGLL